MRYLYNKNNRLHYAKIGTSPSGTQFYEVYQYDPEVNGYSALVDEFVVLSELDARRLESGEMHPAEIDGMIEVQRKKKS